LLHLSDLHLNAEFTRDKGVDADRSLSLVLDACAHLRDIVAVLVTGDIADDGSEAAYARARTALLDFARARDAHLMLCAGNHDDRAAFSAVLGTGHLTPAGEQCGEPGPAGLTCASTLVNGLRIVTLDSLVPGKWFGRIGAEQLAWLQSLLDEEPALPTVIGVHHPPVDLGVEIQQRVRLEDSGRLASTVQSGFVSAILCGHFHQQIAASLSGVPTWVTPGVLHRIDHLTGPPGLERALAGGGAALVDLTRPDSPLFAAIAARDPALGREVYAANVSELADDLNRYGLPR
jgi:3',5'-cyclic AMP phosphodiesterase CpdA